MNDTWQRSNLTIRKTPTQINLSIFLIFLSLTVLFSLHRHRRHWASVNATHAASYDSKPDFKANQTVARRCGWVCSWRRQNANWDCLPLEIHEWRQAVTAAGSGCVAALSVERYLVSKDLLIEFHQPQTEEVKKELTDRDVQAGFDITLTKHKGQYALRKLYHESPRLICVLDTAPTCSPCRTLKPILSKVIGEFDQNVHFVEIDIEEDPEIAEAAGIMGTPCVQFFKNKEMLRTVSGVKKKRVQRIH